MNSDSPTTSRHSHLTAFIHNTLCATCRRSTSEWSRLSRGIERLEDDALPQSLDERLLSDAMTASAAARASSANRSRAAEAFGMKRTWYAAGLAVILMLLGVFLFPRTQGNTALADVMQAMADVKSVHAVGWKLNRFGERERIEIWAGEGGKYRLEYKDAETVVDDGEKLVSLVTYEGQTSVTISQSGQSPDFAFGAWYPELFMGERMTSRVMQEGRLGFAGSRSSVLPDGRKAVVMELRSGPRKALITVDARSNLVQGLEAYDEAGTLCFKFETCEYDVEIPDSVFTAAIPPDAVVTDYRIPLSSVSEDRRKWREQMAEKLDKLPEAICAYKVPGGEGGSQYHSGLRFRCLSHDGLGVWYLKKRNSYYVVGKALVFDESSDFRRTVEDAEFRAPRPSDYVPPPPPPPPTPEELKARAMFEKARVPGAKPVYSSERGAGGSCGSYHNGLRFLMKWRMPLLIQYLPNKNTYRITGKVEIWYPDGRTEVVENADIQAPGPPDRE